MEGSVFFNPEGFQAIRAKLDPVIREHMRECGEMTVRLAKTNSPYITGHNRRSITADFYADGVRVDGVVEGEFAPDPTAPVGGDSRTLGNTITAHSFRVYTQSGYGGYLETGTARMQAQPYIKPGFDEAVAFLKQSLEGAAK